MKNAEGNGLISGIMYLCKIGDTVTKNDRNRGISWNSCGSNPKHHRHKYVLHFIFSTVHRVRDQNHISEMDVLLLVFRDFFSLQRLCLPLTTLLLYRNRMNQYCMFNTFLCSFTFYYINSIRFLSDQDITLNKSSHFTMIMQ